jgi:hypothetical protein
MPRTPPPPPPLQAAAAVLPDKAMEGSHCVGNSYSLDACRGEGGGDGFETKARFKMSVSDESRCTDLFVLLTKI